LNNVFVIREPAPQAGEGQERSTKQRTQADRDASEFGPLRDPKHQPYSHAHYRDQDYHHVDPEENALLGLQVTDATPVPLSYFLNVRAYVAQEDNMWFMVTARWWCRIRLRLGRDAWGVVLGVRFMVTASRRTRWWWWWWCRIRLRLDGDAWGVALGVHLASFVPDQQWCWLREVYYDAAADLYVTQGDDLCYYRDTRPATLSGH